MRYINIIIKKRTYIEEKQTHARCAHPPFKMIIISCKKKIKFLKLREKNLIFV
jgi:hypothetical protein